MKPSRCEHMYIMYILPSLSEYDIGCTNKVDCRIKFYDTMYHITPGYFWFCSDCTRFIIEECSKLTRYVQIEIKTYVK